MFCSVTRSYALIFHSTVLITFYLIQSDTLIWRVIHFIMTVNQLVVGSIPTAGAKNNTLAVNARCFFMSGRTINILAPARRMVGCVIEFFLSGQRFPQLRMCSPENV